jgi:hypothetical protein
MQSNWGSFGGIQNRMQRLSAIEWQPMESLSSQRIEPSADVRKMPNTQRAGQLSQSIATGRQKATYPRLSLQPLDTLTPNLIATLQSLKDASQLTRDDCLPLANHAVRIVDQQ